MIFMICIYPVSDEYDLYLKISDLYDLYLHRGVICAICTCTLVRSIRRMKSSLPLSPPTLTGESDPANYTLPQQPLHPCVLRNATRFGSLEVTLRFILFIGTCLFYLTSSLFNYLFVFLRAFLSLMCGYSLGFFKPFLFSQFNSFYCFIFYFFYYFQVVHCAVAADTNMPIF